MALSVGDLAPDFTLPDHSGQDFSLSEKRGQKLLLVFYPGDDTPVCTRQLCEYRDGIEEYTNLGVDVVGISHNDADSHQKFRDKYDLPFTLLTDRGLKVAEQYGCKGLLGMKRAVFILDANGVIKYEHIESVSVFRRKHEELVEALAAIA
jgi:peroxiredoxin Q/BCP